MIDGMLTFEGEWIHDGSDFDVTQSATAVFPQVSGTWVLQLSQTTFWEMADQAQFWQFIKSVTTNHQPQPFTPATQVDVIVSDVPNAQGVIPGQLQHAEWGAIISSCRTRWLFNAFHFTP